MFSTLGDIMMHVEDIMSTSGDFNTFGDIMSISWWVSWIMSTLADVQYIGIFNRKWKVFTNLLPHMHHDIPTMYWTSSDVFIISLNALMISFDVLMVSPNVLMVFPRCTKHLLMYGTSPMYWTHVIQGDITISFQLAWHIVVTIHNLVIIIILNDYKIASTEIPWRHRINTIWHGLFLNCH